MLMVLLLFFLLFYFSFFSVSVREDATRRDATRQTDRRHDAAKSRGCQQTFRLVVLVITPINYIPTRTTCSEFITSCEQLLGNIIDNSTGPRIVRPKTSRLTVLLPLCTKLDISTSSL
jgi:hypothetical protein